MGVVYEAVRESLAQPRRAQGHASAVPIAAKTTSAGSSRRPVPPLGCTIPTSSACLTTANTTASAFYAMQYIAGHGLDKILDDVRLLHQEKNESADPKAPTVAAESLNESPRNGVGQDALGEDAALNLRQTVTLGLLTGQYASGALAKNASAIETAPHLGHPITPADENPAWAPALAVSCPRFARPGLGCICSNAPPSEPGSANDRVTKTTVDSPSSLTGKTDIRYYREVARLALRSPRR